MTKRVRVNIRALANNGGIRRETRAGREKIIVPSATLPDDIVMNDILYPADEIANSFASLERTPAPYGHPTVGGRFCSAMDPEGINIGWIGAHNENARRDNGRVFVDKVLDVEVANQTSRGKAVIAAIDQGDPVHTSTGLYCDLEPAAEGAKHKYIARNILFDHDAILLEEEGAATPEQGVGMMVNKSLDAKGEEIEVINSALEDAERDLDWAADLAVRAVEKAERAPMLERIKAAIVEAIKGATADQPVNKSEADMADKEQLEALNAKVDGLADGIGKTIADAVSNAVAEAVKPLTDNLAEMQANQKAEAAAKKAGLVNKVVMAGLLDEDTAAELTINALEKLTEKAKPGKAAALNAGGAGRVDDDEFADVDLNDLLEAK